MADINVKKIKVNIDGNTYLLDASAISEISNKLNKTGDTMTGQLYLTERKADVTKADNGVSGDPLYPSTFTMRDKNEIMFARLEGIIRSNGKIGALLWARNFDTAGQIIKENRFGFYIAKDGTVDYIVDEAGKFKSAIGAITGITMNGASKGTSGVINLGTVLTSNYVFKKTVSSFEDAWTDGQQNGNTAFMFYNVSAGASDAPETTGAWQVIQSGSDNYGLQLAMQTDSEHIYFRRRYVGNWNAWVMVSTIADVNQKVSKSGDTMSGALTVNSNITGNKGYFAGTATSSTADSDLFTNGALEIREAGRVANAQSSAKYAPRIGFHWSMTCAGTLAMQNDSKFYFKKQDGTSKATVVANIESDNVSSANYNLQDVGAQTYGTGTIATVSGRGRYVDFPGGLRIQWGNYNTYSNAKTRETSITFPVAFANDNVSVYATATYSNDPGAYGGSVVSTYGVSSTGCTISERNLETSYLRGFNWFAIGYSRNY